MWGVVWDVGYGPQAYLDHSVGVVLADLLKVGIFFPEQEGGDIRVEGQHRHCRKEVHRGVGECIFLRKYPVRKEDLENCETDAAGYDGPHKVAVDENDCEKLRRQEVAGVEDQVGVDHDEVEVCGASKDDSIGDGVDEHQDEGGEQHPTDADDKLQACSEVVAGTRTVSTNTNTEKRGQRCERQAQREASRHAGTQSERFMDGDAF